MIAPRHRQALGTDFDLLARHGTLEVCSLWNNPLTNQPAAISNQRLRELADQYLPIRVTGDPVQSQINRTPSGWVIELINNRGVVKRPDQPTVTDSKAISRVVLTPWVGCNKARQWRSGKIYDHPDVVHVELGPGEVTYVDFLD